MNSDKINLRDKYKKIKVVNQVILLISINLIKFKNNQIIFMIKQNSYSNNNNNLLANNQQNLINEEPEESESFENNTEKLDLKDAKKPVPAVFDVSFDNKCIGVIPEQH